MQARCQLQRRPTFLPSNFYFLRASKAAGRTTQRITKVARNARPTFAQRLRHLQEVPLRRDYVAVACLRPRRPAGRLLRAPHTLSLHKKQGTCGCSRVTTLHIRVVSSCYTVHRGLVIAKYAIFDNKN